MCDERSDHYYPILLDLKDKKALVVGGGKVAHRKIINLLDCGASVEVIARELDGSLRILVEKGLISYGGQEFSEDRMDMVFLVIAATGDAEVNRCVSEQARRKGLLVNAVDQPADCNFIVPSVLRRGDLVISISTSGTSPAFAKKVREELEEHFGDEFEVFLRVMGHLRERVLSLGLSQEKNKGVFEKLVSSRLLHFIREKDWDGAAIIVTETLGRPVSRGELMTYAGKAE
ncbi:MAG: bifunctional precorrin-2 dehydrogenase/sirohydrochlorin ferrochelatase [Deltaproteobacteria bacterium]|nr:bifunctional precorrin-2 dehydrogenase/sirohydrochlorin ferrochelatase [Deltaproteobacteria bacterium]